MNYDFLIGSTQLNQAFETNGSSGGGFTRRTFIKRTGGATVATLVAWNMEVRAQDVNDSASTPGSKKAWVIKVDPVSLGDKSEGSEKNGDSGLDHDGNASTPKLPTRKILELVVSALGTEFAESATSAISITVQEHGEYQANPVTSPDVWTPMDTTQFGRFRGGARDHHEVSASIKKSVNSDTGDISAEDGTPSNYDETKGGINIKLSWEGDKLKVTWSSADIAAETKEVEPVFHIRANSITLN